MRYRPGSNVLPRADSNGGKDKGYYSKSIFGAVGHRRHVERQPDYVEGTKICSTFWWRNDSTKPGNVNGHVSFGNARDRRLNPRSVRPPASPTPQAGTACEAFALPPRRP
jgi:hypothetical protein